MIELEKKAFLNNPSLILKKLYKEAYFVGEFYKKDFYYTSSKSFKKLIHQNNFFFEKLSHLAIFRVRFFKDNFEINYKKKQYFQDGELNNESEMTFSKKKWSFFRNFFRYIKYRCFLKKKKKTLLFKWKDLSVEYNKVDGLGFFLEIEYLFDDSPSKDKIEKKNQEINEFFNYLGLFKFENKLYMELLLEKKINKGNINYEN